MTVLIKSMASPLGFDGARAPRFKGLFQCGAHCPDRHVVEIKAVTLAGFQRFNEELPLGDFQNQRIALGGLGVGLLTHLSDPSLWRGRMHPLYDRMIRSMREYNQLKSAIIFV
jgi:hypothetical protein